MTPGFSPFLYTISAGTRAGEFNGYVAQDASMHNKRLTIFKIHYAYFAC